MLTDSTNTTTLDALCSQQAYITGFDSFLDEADDTSSLRYWLTEFVSNQCLTSSEDIIPALQRSISDIDHLINDQLNVIIHEPQFQRLEASWRGLWYLANEADGIRNIKIKVLDISWQEVSRDISRALEFDQSQLFKKIYSEEYGTPGGEPYGVIIGDYEISHKPSATHSYDDIATLEGISQIAAASFAPFLAAAAPQLFGLDDFATLGHPLDLPSQFLRRKSTSSGDRCDLNQIHNSSA